MDRLDLRCLAKRLEGESQVYSFHINSRTSPNKYPAKQHARAVANRLEVTEGLIYLAGAPTAFLEDSDQSAPFRQRRYFFYFSGCDEADCHILYDISKDKLVLYIPEIDARKAVWGGAGSTKPEAEAKYDADGVKYTSHLKDDVKKWWNKGSGRLYLLHPDQTVTPYCLDSETLDVGRIDALLLRYTTDLCRVIKDDHEIKLIRRANEVSAHAHRAVLKNIHSFQNESQVEAIFLDTSISEGAKHQAYSIIAGSGMNAAVLHYVNNNEPLADRQLLLIDAGAEWDCYASDVTRTFPISGKWTKEAKDIYDLVDEMQTACMTRMKPGTHFRDLQVLAHFIAVTGLMKLGILHNGTRDEILAAGTSTAFFPHGLGHHVGLEVHDVIDLPFTMATGEHFSQSEVFKDTEFPTGDPSLLAQLYQTLIDPSLCKGPLLRQGTGLQEGMIVTVEPGIYFSQYALTRVFLPNPVHARYINKQVLAKYMLVGGVRIEDDILITRDGYENLTTAPKGDEALKIIRGDRVPSNADLDTSYGEDSIHIPSMTLEDLDTYSRVFRQLSSKEDSGLIQGEEAREFLAQSGLPSYALAQVWMAVDTCKRNALDLTDFSAGMQMIRFLQKQSPANLPRILTLLPQLVDSSPCSSLKSRLTPRKVVPEAAQVTKTKRAEKKAAPTLIHKTVQRSLLDQDTEAKTLVSTMIKSIDRLSEELSVWNQSLDRPDSPKTPEELRTEGSAHADHSLEAAAFLLPEEIEAEILNDAYPPLPASPPQVRTYSSTPPSRERMHRANERTLLLRSYDERRSSGLNDVVVISECLTPATLSPEQEKVRLPAVPYKIPNLPSKPLAYRQSLPVLPQIPSTTCDAQSKTSGGCRRTTEKAEKSALDRITPAQDQSQLADWLQQSKLSSFGYRKKASTNASTSTKSHLPVPEDLDTPMSAAKFIAVHGDTLHIRFAAAIVTELSRYPPSRELVTGDEILELMQKGTCWAGLCSELPRLNIDVVPAIGRVYLDCEDGTSESWANLGLIAAKTCATDMRTLKFWLGVRGMRDKCGICPVCLDSKVHNSPQKIGMKCIRHGAVNHRYSIAQEHSSHFLGSSPDEDVKYIRDPGLTRRDRAVVEESEGLFQFEPDRFPRFG